MKPSLIIAFIPTIAAACLAMCEVGKTLPARGEVIRDGSIVVAVILFTAIPAAFGYFAAKIEGGDK